MRHSTPLEARTPPVTAAELAEFIGLASPSVAETAMLEGLINAACDMVTMYCNKEFLERKWSLTQNILPADGTFIDGFAPRVSNFNGVIELPFAPVASVEGVYLIDIEGYEEELDAADYMTVKDIFPCQVILKGWPYADRVRVEFTAGHEDEYAIPPAMLLAVKVCAAWLYEKRGTCEAADSPLKASGAAAMLSGEMVRFTL